MPPMVAQAPKATSTLDFLRSRLATYSFSLLRMQPLKRQTSMKPSSYPSTSLYLKSAAAGQKTTS